MKAIVILITLFCFRSYAQNCNYNITVNNFVGTIQTQQQAVSHSFSISSGSNSNNCKNFRAFYGKGNANNYNRKVFSGNKMIDYNVYKESGLNTVLKDFGDAGAGEFISGNLESSNTSYSFDFFFKLIDLDSVFSNGPGHYNDLIPISVYSVKNNGSLTHQKTVYMNVGIVIPRYAELSVGPENMPHDPSATQHVMDFGTLESHEEARALLNIKGNVPFGIYMASQNGGALTNGPSRVPYTIQVGSNSFITLSNPGQSHYITQHNSGTPQSSLGFPLRVRIGEVPSNPDSGDYTDVITITVNAW